MLRTLTTLVHLLSVLPPLHLRLTILQPSSHPLQSIACILNPCHTISRARWDALSEPLGRTLHLVMLADITRPWCVFSSSLHLLNMHPQPGTHCALPSTMLGMGQQFSSPKKWCDKRKTQTNVTIPGQSAKRQRLLQQLNNLFNHNSSSPPPSGTNSPPLEENVVDALDGTQMIQHPADEPMLEDVAC